MNQTSDALTANDPRYKDMFNVERETTEAGHVLIDDPYPHFARLREIAPIYPGDIDQFFSGKPNPHFSKGRPHYTTLTFKGCSDALIENGLYSSLHYREMSSVMLNIGHTILTMIGDEHMRTRAAVQPLLSRPQAMGWWREKWIEPFVNVLLDSIAGEAAADLSLQLCARLPMHTVTAAYGMDSDEALDFRQTLLSAMSPLMSAEQQREQTERGRAMLSRVIAERRRERRDDLISRLIDAPFTDAEGNASFLDDEQIISFSRLLLLAGGGTTFRQLGITIFALLSNREQVDALRADRSLMPAAIQESVRWNCTDPLFHRLALRDSVLEGCEIPEGAIIDVCLGAGNRDPERWENPDAYDLHRPAQRHVGFAGGPHTCLGRFVAEAEMASAVNGLLDRFPNLRLDDNGEPAKIIGGLGARGVNHLRVRLD